MLLPFCIRPMATLDKEFEIIPRSKSSKSLKTKKKFTL